MTPIDPTLLAGIALAMFGVAGGINQVMSIVDRVKGRPSAEQLKVTADALAERVLKVEAEHREFVEKESFYRREIYERIEKLRGEIKGDINGVHGRLTELLAAFAELRGAFKTSQEK